MSARYLIRLDDACSQMESTPWLAIEALFDRLAIRPIVAIVPDNRDPGLGEGPGDTEFWKRARGWQAKGWAIAQHGWQHVLHATDAAQYLPFHNRSEFVGLDLEEQAAKVRSGYAAMTAHGVTPTVWVAPAHSFDRTTLAAVERETPIRIVSDGIARGPFFADGFHWLPQQLWSLATRSDGVWTICLHPSTMTERDVTALGDALRGPFAGKVAAVDDIELTRRGRTIGDALEVARFWGRHHAYRGANLARKLVRRG